MFSSPSKKMPSTQALLIAVVAVVALLVLVNLILNSLPSRKKGVSPIAPSAPPVGNIVKSPTISGTVTKTGTDSITFEVRQLHAENGLKEDVSMRVARVTSKTTMTLLVEQTPEKYRMAQEAYAKAMKDSDPAHPPAFPFPFSNKQINLDEIKPGDTVIVTSVDDADISKSTEFNVSSISVKRSDFVVPPPVTPSP